MKQRSGAGCAQAGTRARALDLTHISPRHTRPPTPAPTPVINHAYNTQQRTNCSTSWVSSHFFSADGVVWGHSDQPYSHTVQYDDGTTHSYCTLERPALTFDSQGLLTHINLAADLVTQDEGCASRGKGCVDVREGPH